ncbi:hypothetical protein GIB67_003046 [Kingdonia uniflora]|uniref:AP2/ERF domain-containing protein n=1 Tax=Kingdonia uniflora TaxID=39325 RepID=A0A7J7LYM3_9MAGN|nr:hypothetical protein GIB67_003046 [Kingdonia uniflora]
MVKTEEKTIIQSDPSSPKSRLSPSASSSTCRKSKYKGVRMRSWGSWVSEIRSPNQKTRIWLGSYSTPEAAARAYDAALICLKGSSANLNFPNTSSSLPYINAPDTIMSPKSIQKVAAAAANNTTTFVTVPTTSTTTTTTTTTLPSSPPVPPPLSEFSPETSTSSSSYNEDDTSFMPCWADYATTTWETIEEPVVCSTMDGLWADFGDLQLPKYTDQMFNASLMLTPPPTMEDFYEESDIRLWNFC